MIERYRSFIEDREIKSIDESMIYYTMEFKDSLFKLRLKSQIAQALIEVEYTDVKPDMTFIGMSDKEGYFSFTQINKAARAAAKSGEELEKKYGIVPGSVSNQISKKILDGSISQSDVNHFYNEEPYALKSKARSEAKIAKLVNQIFPGKFSEKEVEEFTNAYKALYKKAQFELVRGKEIAEWYPSGKYTEQTGDLGNSCMRYTSCEPYFGIYTENPEVCSMLILKDGDLISGRALVWKLDEPVEGAEYYMDRVYWTDEAIKALFSEYADKNGWLKRRTSRYDDCRDFVLGDNTISDQDISVTLKKWEFEKYPYMDTLKSLETETGRLLNTDDDTKEGRFIMTQTDGGHTDTSGVWSNWEDDFIPREDAVWSDHVDSWLREDRAVRVGIGRTRHRGWYPEDDESLNFDRARETWVREEDTVWSDYHDSYIYEGDATEAIVWIDPNYSNKKECDWTQGTVSDYATPTIITSAMECGQYLSEKTDENHIIVDILQRSEQTGKYYLSDYEVVLFDTERGYLSERDAETLGIKKRVRSRKTDELAYHSLMDDMLKSDLLKAYKEKEGEARAVATGKQGVLDLGEDEKDREEFAKAVARDAAKKADAFKERVETLSRWI